MEYQQFQTMLRQRGEELYRDMPWRHDTRPYYVLVSELMLQQTQVDRVIPKFNAFIKRFPDEASLAAASLSEVLTFWNGLGYNRRAKYLHDAARMIIDERGGRFPAADEQLRRLPGVGPGTAGALQVYAFNRPVVYVETNVRTVYFHHFFGADEKVSDVQIAALVEQTLDRGCPREFYWALMDYGSWLKRQGAGRNQQSQHYRRQAPLAGSVREVRGLIVRLLTEGTLPRVSLLAQLPPDERAAVALAGLVKDGLVIESSDGTVDLTK